MASTSPETGRSAVPGVSSAGVVAAGTAAGYYSGPNGGPSGTMSVDAPPPTTAAPADVAGVSPPPRGTRMLPAALAASAATPTGSGLQNVQVALQNGLDPTHLIVNYLPLLLTQEGLHQLFAEVGNLESCKLMVDRMTGQSLGFGFVKYSTAEEASAAMHRYNGLSLGNKVLKVSYARPSSEDIKRANLYIAGLPLDWTKTDLESHFAPFGLIIESKVLMDHVTHVSRGVGFVRFNTSKEAEAAMHALHGQQLVPNGPPLTVKLAEAPHSQMRKRTMLMQQQMMMAAAAAAAGVPAAGPPPPPRPSSMHPHHLGHPLSPTIAPPPPPPLHHHHQQPGAAPLSPMMYDAAAAAAAAAAANMTFPPRYMYAAGAPVAAPPLPGAGRGMSTSPLRPSIGASTGGNASHLGYCLFVYHLPPDGDENLLYHLFSQHGTVLSVKVIRDPATMKSKGFGFVNMAKLEGAHSAILNLNGFQVASNKFLSVAFKTERQ